LTLDRNKPTVSVPHSLRLQKGDWRGIKGSITVKARDERTYRLGKKARRETRRRSSLSLERLIIESRFRFASKNAIL
jgi:hypothetical protein